MLSNVIDDHLVTVISEELAHQGLIVPISEIESSIIKVYDNIQKAHAEDNSNRTVSSYIKDVRYYTVLKNAVCAEIVSRVRLANAANSYEVASILALLQGYLDNLAEAAGTIRTAAPEVFAEVLDKLSFDATGQQPIKMMFVDARQIKPADQGSTGKPRSNGTVPAENHNPMTGLLTGSLADFLGMSSPQVERKKQLDAHNTNVCTNAVDCGSCELCSSCSASDELDCCGNYVSLSLMYKGMCYGLKVSPETLGLHELAYKSELPDKSNLLRNTIGLMARKLKQKSQEIWVNFYGAYHNQEDDEDE